MKKIKVSIQDENTLILLEDASKGDLIDLKSIHETDIDKTAIESVVRSIKIDKFQEELKKETRIIEERLTNQLREKEWEWKQNELKKLQEKEKEISELKSKNELAEMEKKLAITQALGAVEKERDALINKLENKETEKLLLEKSLNEKFLTELKTKDEMIEYYKDMKLKMSTKMLGETLEQHCEIEFNKIRATAFPKAYFEKDNDARS
jgi:hypothetical protein